MPPKRAPAASKKKAPKRKSNTVTITIAKAKTVTIPDPERFLSSENWQFMNATQLSSQCKMVGIPASGTKDDKAARLERWYENPSAFEAPPKKKATKKRKSALDQEAK